MSHFTPTGTPVTRLRQAILHDIHDAEDVVRDALIDLNLGGGNANAPRIMARIRAAILKEGRDSAETETSLKEALSDLLA